MLEQETLKRLFEKKKVYADISVVTNENIIEFINENYLWLKGGNRKIIVHKGIKEKLRTLLSDKRRMIGMAVIEYLEKKEMIEYFGNDDLPYEPLKYLEHFVVEYLTEEIAILTNDFNLMKDIITINHFSSISILKQIMVYRVNRNGKIGVFLNTNKESIEV